jgi:hypothetical protein
MDSISRGCLLAYLRANPGMSYEEIVQFIEGMQPMEVEVVNNNYLPPGLTLQELGSRGWSTGTRYSLWPTHMG